MAMYTPKQIHSLIEDRYKNGAQPFLNNIEEEPKELTYWVFADWLEERDQMEAGKECRWWNQERLNAMEIMETVAQRLNRENHNGELACADWVELVTYAQNFKDNEGYLVINFGGDLRDFLFYNQLTFEQFWSAYEVLTEQKVPNGS